MLKSQRWYCATAAVEGKQQQFSQSISVWSCTQVPEGTCASQGLHDVKGRIEEQMDDLTAEKS
jgi:hypothetical protein